MWIDNATYREDLERIVAASPSLWEPLVGKTVFITGGTGLVGQNVVNALLYYGLKYQKPIRVLALVRSREKAQALYAQQLAACLGQLAFLVGDVTDPLTVDEPIDYFIHGASQTASAAFVASPVDTIETAIGGTRNMLELARAKGCSSFLYLSSMETYGAPHTDAPLTEDCGACFDSMAVRSCYPESKRMCEALCAAYAAQYGLSTKVIRLAQTFGPGVRGDDVRVFAEFARLALAGKDIVLLTKGDSCRMYLYTMDAAAAILTVLVKGAAGSCYNAANRDTYCSVLEMAHLVARTLGQGKPQVIVRAFTQDRAKYPPSHKLRLDTTKLEALGWKPGYGLEEMYQRMVKGF